MIIVFDGVCNFCNGWVRFVLKRDGGARFRFVAAQSLAGGDLLAQSGCPRDALDTVLLVDGDRYFKRSEAVLRVLRELDGFRHVADALLLVPRAIRDACYDAFARRRYRLFGRSSRCPVPDPRWSDRFIV